MQKQTTGTWVFIVANCAVVVCGVLQGVDWLHLIGSANTGWVMATIAAVNAFAHYFTGPPTSDSK